VLRAADLAELPQEARADFIARLSPEEAALVPYLWEFWARAEQLLPAGDWVYWLPLGGRGCGKTRTGAETVRRWIRTNAHVNIIGATADDVRDIMVEGESGILNVCPPDERPKLVSARNRLEWPNGARTLLFSAESPERLRGKQHAKLWCDELAAWRYPEAWDQAVFGLRLNTILDALEAALNPANGARQTLGGLVSHCRIEGAVLKDPGDLDGDGLLWVPIKILAI